MTSVEQHVVDMTRRTIVSACHRLHSPHLTNEENAKIFGKCNNPNGHGHNYTVDVTLKGPVDENTGMVFDLVKLKQLIKLAVEDQLDHKNIDKDVSYFNSCVSTTENITAFVWNSLLEHMDPADKSLLHCVTVHSTAKNSFAYHG